MLGTNASHVKYINALSGQYVGSGSTNASNFAGFEWATLILTTGSFRGGSVTLNVERSATSDGTFSTFGASTAAIVGGATTNCGHLFVRSFALDSSAIWYKLAYNTAGTDGKNLAAVFELSAARVNPVATQDGNTTIYSDVIAG